MQDIFRGDTSIDTIKWYWHFGRNGTEYVETKASSL